MHAGLMLSETGADEAWLAGQLRRVTQLCHAHGALAGGPLLRKPARAGHGESRG